MYKRAMDPGQWPTAERRYKIAYVTPEILASLFSFTGIVLIEGKAPPAAKLVGAHFDAGRRSFAVVLEHPSFPLTKEGDLLPTLEPITITSVQDR